MFSAFAAFSTAADKGDVSRFSQKDVDQLLSQADMGSARRLRQKALDLYLSGEFQSSLQEVGEALKLEANHLPTVALRGRIWYALGNQGEALRDARRVLSHQSRTLKDASDYIARGSALLLTEDPSAALSSFEAALQLEGGSFEAMAGKARVWRARGDHQKELSVLDEILEQSLKPPPLYRYNRAHAYYDLGRTDDAIKELAAVLRLNRNFYLAYGLLGVSLAKKGDLPRALKAYDRAIALNPKFAYAYQGRGALRLARDEKDAALKDYDEAVHLSPQNWSALFDRGEAWWRRGNKEEAMSDYRRALAADIPDARSAMTVGDKFAYLLLWPEAIASYEKARNLKGGAASLIRLAVAREHNRQGEKALEDLDDAVKENPSAVEAYLARGLLNGRLGHEKNALTDLNQAFKLDPKNVETLVARGSFLARTNKPNAALEDFNAAIALSPSGSGEAYNNRGALQANAFFDLDNALKDLQKAVELGPKDAGYRFNLGVIYLKRHQYLQALESLNASLGLRGPAVRILQYRAETHSQLGWRSKAMQDVQAALEKDPKNPALNTALGAIRMRFREYDLALQDLDVAVKLDGKSAAAWLQRGLAHAHLGSYKKSLYDLQKAVEVDPQSKEGWTALCSVRRVSKDPEEAVKNCSRAITLDESHAPAYLHRGLAHFRMGEPFKAIDDIDRAARLGLKRPEAYLALSVSHRAAQQFRQAHLSFLEAMSLDPEAHTPELLFGAARGDKDDYYNAIAEIDSAGDSDTSDPYLYLVRGDAHYNAGRYERVIQEYTRAMEIDGTLADAYRARGAALMASDAFEASQQDLQRAIEIDPRDAASHVRLAALHLLQGEYKKAIEQAGKALVLDPNNAEAHLRAGNAHYFQKKYKKALEHYQASSKADPYNANAYNGIGLGLFALKRYPEALENFSRAIALYPSSDRYYRNRGSTFTNMGEFANAAMDFKLASMVNSDPALIDEYNVLITESLAKTQRAGPASVPAPGAEETTE